MTEADPDTVRVRLGISYDGTEFSGWAVQTSRRTVQGVLEAALAQILRLDHVRLTVAGRTDAGVHAIGQVAHVDLPRSYEISPHLLRRLNRLLPDDVRVLSLGPAAAGFDARFSATWRSYSYRITDAPFGALPLDRRTTLAWPTRLDADAMDVAASQLLGVHDFAAYCRFRPDSTTIRGLETLSVTRVGDLVLVKTRADAFCYSMVRSLVGALLAVGDGRRPIDWPASLLSLTSRSSEVPVAPAHGLTLVAVGYPPTSELAARTEITRAVRHLS